MDSIVKKHFVLGSFCLLFGFLNSEYLAETKKQSIINLFCLENIKEEMLKANMKYDQQIAEHTCDCFFREFTNMASHQKAVYKCKLETKKEFNL